MNIKYSEEESIRLRIDWESSTLFTHANENHIDHVFVELPEDQQDAAKTLGAFVWRQILPDFDDLMNGLITHDFPHVHMPFPNPADVDSYSHSGLKPPEKKSLFNQEPVVIEEAEDNDIVSKAMDKIDHEIGWFLNDPHYYDKRKPRDE